MSPSRPLADTEKLPVRTHRSEALKSPGEDGDVESVPQEPKKRSSKEKKEKKKDKDKDRKVCQVNFSVRRDTDSDRNGCYLETKRVA